MTTPYRNTALPVAERVDDLLSQMTLEEKVGQLIQYFGGLGGLFDDIDVSALPPEHQAYVLQPKMVEAAVAAGMAGSVLSVSNPSKANELQRMAVDGTRLGIPLLLGSDVIHGFRTIFPVPIAQAASWDPSMIEAGDAVAAREARAVGIHWTFAPMIDISRDARWGRIVEGVGEDPYLGAAVAAAHVRGFQGAFGPERILAGPKHFAGYGAPRGGRDYEEVELSESELRNVYLPPFQAAIDAGAANVMAAYMELNGVPASANTWLLDDVLRGEMGFDGFVVSDASGVKNLEKQHFAATAADAGARAVAAGIDMEMCMLEPAFGELTESVARGTVDESTIDSAVRRVLTAKFRLGLFENPFVDESAVGSVLDAPEHRESARIAAERSIVLLKNEGAALPLDASTFGSIAVIGQLAGSKREVLGPWVFAHDTEESVSIVDGLRARLEGTVSIEFAPGAGIPSRIYPSMFDGQDPTVENTPADYDDDAEIARAVALAAAADLAIVVVGERQNQIGEKSSRSTLDLPGRQLEQLQKIAATGTSVVLVVMSGRPLDLRWADENVPAIVQVWYPGTRGGDAVASVLFGDVSPAGRLPFTWPRHVGHVPMVYSHMRTFDPDGRDQRYWDEPSTPLYPFGHGLSYAAFAYDNLRVDRERVAADESVTVTVDVTNTSDRTADEVVQLYIHQRHGTAVRPVRELKGFERVAMGAGETRTVTFTLGEAELRYWNAASRDWVQDASAFDVWVGGDSTASLSTTFSVE
ncbi:glycoside hydrolase family 3 N-terminal domain-containing protein [Microbacterium hominis]|uniref:Exo-alpha-(1->6)-L-arabinopyranosidase n=1 Tax=Microbacterium hominis TaxID=162426 RepID=A0A7D4PLJ1_9MICO|nr:glycoside hydrolase family 3 N-terminal domain-containing protein [Microbacterium hominis]QKJ18910.1 glycoside hydrolase family 3 C-terminal domain-containing protein [Microbacterium hominis]